MPEFVGFRRPYYTQVPDEVFDMFLPDLSGAELKVLLYICRRTLGFKKDTDNISLAQIVGGIKRKDGSRLDLGTGLAKSTVLPALRSLRDRGLIDTEQRSNAQRGDLPTTYSLRFRPDDPWTENTTTGWTENATTGSTQNTTTPVAENPATQETVVQETDGQDRSNRPAPSSLKSDDAALILSYIADFGLELHDTAPTKASAARASNLYLEFGGSNIAGFCALLNEAKVRTQTHAPKRGTRMGYFFGCLESLVREGR